MENESTRRVTISFPLDVYEEIQREAKDQERSFNGEVIWRLRRYWKGEVRHDRDCEWSSESGGDKGGLWPVAGPPEGVPITVGNIAVMGTLQAGGNPDGYLSLTDRDGETWRIPYWNAVRDAWSEEP